MWRQKPHEASYDYRNSNGEVVANVRMVGIKGRWRWSCGQYKDKDRAGWFGTRFTKEQAQAAAEDYLRARGAL
jgi:hypothetical protein